MKTTSFCAALLAVLLSSQAQAIVRASVIIYCDDPAELMVFDGICISVSMTSASALESVITNEIGMHSLHQSPSGWLNEYPHEFLPVPLGQSASIYQGHEVFAFPGTHWIEGWHEAYRLGAFYWYDITVDFKNIE